MTCPEVGLQLSWLLVPLSQGPGGSGVPKLPWLTAVFTVLHPESFPGASGEVSRSLLAVAVACVASELTLARRARVQAV